MTFSTHQPHFLLLTKGPKELQMLQQALLQGWPDAVFHESVGAPEARKATLIIWGDAFKSVRPELLAERQAIVVFEDQNDPARIEAIRRNFPGASPRKTGLPLVSLRLHAAKFQEQKRPKTKMGKSRQEQYRCHLPHHQWHLVDVNPWFESLFGYARKVAGLFHRGDVVAPGSRSLIEERLKRIK